MDTRVLLLEDDAHLARGICFNLEAEGYDVELFEDGESALEWLRAPDRPRTDLLVLDVMLPGISGFRVLRELREGSVDLPVLMLTARDSEEDIVRGLDMGADDYLTKPFSLPVLLARVRSLLRRRKPDERVMPAPFDVGACRVYPDRFELERDGVVSALTAKELGLLTLFWERRGSAVSRGEVLESVWDLHPDTKTRVVDTFVSRLRKLLEEDPSEPRYLLSVRSFGYRLIDSADTEDSEASPE